MFGYVNLPIGEICKIQRGKVISKQEIVNQKGIYPVYSSQTENDGKLGCINTFMYDGEYLTWTTDGANAGTVFLRQGKFNITNVCGLLDSNTALADIHFLYYSLSMVSKLYVKRGMGNAKLMSNEMAKIKIKLPSLIIQHKIAKILDSFSKIVFDISSGLPAEIEARKKQYEYYRDKFLDFKEKKG